MQSGYSCLMGVADVLLIPLGESCGLIIMLFIFLILLRCLAVLVA